MTTSRFLDSRMFLVCILSALATFTASAQGQTNQATGAAGQDKTAAFLRQAARNNDMEIALAEVGARKAENQQLKQYCLRLQHEQMQTGQQLQPIIRQHGLTLDQNLTKMDSNKLSKLENASGTKFDRTLAVQLLIEQQRSVVQLEEAPSRVSASDVQQFAQQTLPAARQHLQQTETLAKDVGVKQETISAITQREPKAVGGTGDLK